MIIPEYLIVIAASARMLAQAARKSGLKALVIDLFADLDTQSYAEAYRQVASLAIEQLAPAVNFYIEQYPVRDVIYGSGFECHSESLSYLHKRLNILGNDPSVFSQIHNKTSFFATLAQLGIAFPEVCFEPPVQPGDWLVKPISGQGGLGIQRFCDYGKEASNVYWQKFQPGKAYSVLFLTNGQSAQVIGFNSQWTQTVHETEHFSFSGVINATDLTDEQKQQMAGHLVELVAKFKLKGLNSLDFIQCDNKSHVLEINPRPSASMQLYEGDLLYRHILAVQGLLTGALADPSGFSAYQIVYASADVQISEHVEWPEAAQDLPPAGTIVKTGEPICSMIAHHTSAKAVREQLSNTQVIILNLMERLQTHAISCKRQ